MAETLFGFGCYTGEVLTRNTDARWRTTTDEELHVVGWPILVELGPQRWCNPIGKVFKRLENGPEDSLHYFYAVFTKPTQ